MAGRSTRTAKSRSPRTRARRDGRSGGRAIAFGALSLGAMATLGAAAFALLGRRGAGTSRDGSFGTGEHSPVDLTGDRHPGPGDRAADAFRPDPTAPVPEGERDAFRPAPAGAAAPRLVAGQARELERIDAAPS